LCAMGLLLTDLRADFAMTRLLPLAPDAAGEGAAAFAALDSRAAAWFAQENIAVDLRRLPRTVDMRYTRQNYELAVPLPDGPLTARTLDLLSAGFAEAHQRMYGFLAEEEPVQMVAYRLEATGLVAKAAMAQARMSGPDASGAIRERRDVWIAEEGRSVACPIYDRDLLRPGDRFLGPAIVEQMDATTLVPPGMTTSVDKYLNLILEAA